MQSQVDTLPSLDVIYNVTFEQYWGDDAGGPEPVIEQYQSVAELPGIEGFAAEYHNVNSALRAVVEDHAATERIQPMTEWFFPSYDIDWNPLRVERSQQIVSFQSGLLTAKLIDLIQRHVLSDFSLWRVALSVGDATLVIYPHGVRYNNECWLNNEWVERVTGWRQLAEDDIRRDYGVLVNQLNRVQQLIAAPLQRIKRRFIRREDAVLIAAFYGVDAEDDGIAVWILHKVSPPVLQLYDCYGERVSFQRICHVDKRGQLNHYSEVQNGFHLIRYSLPQSATYTVCHLGNENTGSRVNVRIEPKSSSVRQEP